MKLFDDTWVLFYSLFFLGLPSDAVFMYLVAKVSVHNISLCTQPDAADIDWAIIIDCAQSDCHLRQLCINTHIFSYSFFISF